MRHDTGWGRGIVGIWLLTLPIVVMAGTEGMPDKPMTGDTVIRETQQAVTATKDYTIQQKDIVSTKDSTRTG